MLVFPAATTSYWAQPSKKDALKPDGVLTNGKEREALTALLRFILPQTYQADTTNIAYVISTGKIYQNPQNALYNRYLLAIMQGLRDTISLTPEQAKLKDWFIGELKAANKTQDIASIYTAVAAQVMQNVARKEDGAAFGQAPALMRLPNNLRQWHYWPTLSKHLAAMTNSPEEKKALATATAKVTRSTEALSLNDLYLILTMAQRLQAKVFGLADYATLNNKLNVFFDMTTSYTGLSAKELIALIP